MRCAATATAAATTHGSISDFLPLQSPASSARNTAVKAKSNPQRAGSSRAPPTVRPTSEETVQAGLALGLFVYGWVLGGR